MWGTSPSEAKVVKFKSSPRGNTHDDLKANINEGTSIEFSAGSRRLTERSLSSHFENSEQDDDDRDHGCASSESGRLPKFKRKKKKKAGLKDDTLPTLTEDQGQTVVGTLSPDVDGTDDLLSGRSEEQREALVASHRMCIQKVVMDSYEQMLEAIMQHTSTLQVSLGLGLQQPLASKGVPECDCPKTKPHRTSGLAHRKTAHITVGHATVKHSPGLTAMGSFHTHQSPREKHHAGFFHNLAHTVAETVRHEIHGTVDDHGRHHRKSHAAHGLLGDTQKLRGSDADTSATVSFSSSSFERNSMSSYDSYEEVHQPNLFADPDAMKAQLRETLTKEKYDVTHCYWQEGCAQAIARSLWFEHLTLLVIAVNAIWIAIDVDLNCAATLADSDSIFIIMDNFFCTYFCFDLSVRYAAFKVKSHALQDRWFHFDAILCAMMVAQTWVLTAVVSLSEAGSSSGPRDPSVLKLFRMLRLLRMARVIHILNALPELMVLIKGMQVACRAVSCTVLLLLVIIYVFAVAFRQLTYGTPVGDETFPSVLISMRFLLIQGTMPDLHDAIIPIWEDNHFYAVFFMFFVLIVTITVMNMLVGVLFLTVNTVSTVEKEQLMVQFVKHNLLALLQECHADEDQDGNISRKEFDQLIQLPMAIRSFQSMGVDVVGLVDLADFIFKDDEHTLTIGDFFELVLQLRGSNQATVKDIVDLRKCVGLEFGQLRAELDDLLIPVKNHFQMQDMTRGGGPSVTSRPQQPKRLGTHLSLQKAP